jgi:alkylhydroperoxidase family enzyme
VIEASTSSNAARPAPEVGPCDLAAAVTVLAATVGRAERGTAGGNELLDALTALRRVRGELAAFEPALIAAARACGVSWQALAPAMGVASRQAAERRYMRSTAAPTDEPGATRDTRVQAERDRRAGERAVTRWANDNTADLRQLAGQITALADLDDAADETLARLHDALGGPDASSLPALLTAVQRHLPQHPGLTGQIEAVTAHTAHIREHPSRHHHGNGPGDGGARAH